MERMNGEVTERVLSSESTEGSFHFPGALNSPKMYR